MVQHGPNGSEYVINMMDTFNLNNLVKSSQKQDRNPFEFLASLMEVAFKGEDLPSLV